MLSYNGENWKHFVGKVRLCNHGKVWYMSLGNHGKVWYMHLGNHGKVWYMRLGNHGKVRYMHLCICTYVTRKSVVYAPM